MNIIKVQYGADIPDNFTGIVEYEDGDKKEWYKEGKYHREDGPAIEHENGSKEWWFEDKIHRIDGPAVEYSDETKGWWIDGIHYAERNLEYFCKNCIFLGKEKGKHGLVWLKFLDEDEIEEFPIIPGMDISSLQRMESKNGI